MQHLRLGPFHGQLCPQLARQHPAESRKEVSPIEQVRPALVDVAYLAVVVPRGHTPQRRVVAEQLIRAEEVFVKVGRHIQIVWI